MERTDILFSSIQLGKVNIKNRVALAPMGTRSNLMDGTISERCSIYLEERAKGGAGLIIPEFTAVTQGYTWIPSMQIYSDRLIPSLSRLAESIHNHDSRIIMQLAHHGGRAASAVTGQRCVAPSAVASPLYKEIPEALSVEEIYRLTEDWRTAAIRAKRAGFDGVEIHGCHGYLINQFISPATNKRTDEFGGCLENRMRFAKLIVQAVREACGDGFIIGFKMAAYEELEGGNKLKDAPEIARAVEGMGVDYIHVSSTSSTVPGHEYTEYPSVPCMYDGRNCLAPLAKAVKDAVSVPVILASAIVDPEAADELIRTGVTDMVAVGRGFLAEPYWGRKPQQGEAIRPCIGCMTCHKHTLAGTDLVCAVNGGLLREFYDHSIGKHPQPRKVMVIGGGPGGMEAAIRAHDRGHHVVLYERGGELGGALKAASAPAFKHRTRRLLEFYRGELERRGIRVVLNAEILADNADAILKEENFDVAVVAVGGVPVRPPVPGVDGSNVFVAERVLLEPSLCEGDGPVNIIGCGKVGMETAWLLGEQGRKVRIFEMMPAEKLMADDHPTTRSVLLHRMEEHKVEIHAGAKVLEISQNGILAELSGEKKRFDGDYVLLAAGYRKNSGLYQYLLTRRQLQQVYEIGDGKAPKGLIEAIHGGYYAGMYRI